MFRGGSHGLFGEGKKPKLSPPMSRKQEFEGTGDESWTVISNVGSDRGKAAKFRPSYGRERERGTIVG